MGCDVCISTDIGGFEYEPFYSRTLRAAKDHTCEECAGTISRGALFHYATGCDGDDWSNHVVCLFCHAVMKAFMCKGIQYGGMLWEMAEEDVFPELTMSSDCFLKLPAAHRGQLLRRWWAWKSEQLS